MGRLETIILRHIQLGLILLSAIGLLIIGSVGGFIPYVNVIRDQLLKFLATVLLLSLISSKTSFRTVGFWSLLGWSIWQAIDGGSVIQPLIFTLLFIPKGLRHWFKQTAIKIWSLLRFLYTHHFWKLVLASATVITLLFYHKSVGSYFEGDEWVFFRFYAPAVKSNLWFIQGFIDTLTKQKDLNVHMTPLSNMVYVIQYKLFGLRFVPYILSSFMLHIGASLSVCFFILRLTKSKKVALLTTLFFAAASTHSQAVTWVVASVYTILAVIFGNISLGLLLDYTQRSNVKKLFLSFVFLLLALISKETAITYLLTYPILYFLTKKPEQKMIDCFKGVLLVSLIFIGLQLPNISFLSENQGSFNTSKPWSYALLDRLDKVDSELFTYRYVAIAQKSLVQSLVYPKQLTDLTVFITRLQLPFFNQEANIGGATYLNFIQQAGPEFLSYGFALSIVIIVLMVQVPAKYQRAKKIGIISFLISILAILAITIKFPWWGYNAVVDARHLYHLTPFTFLLLSLVILSTTRILAKKFSFSQNLLVGCVVTGFLIYQFLSLQNKTINLQKDLSLTDRKMIVAYLQDQISPVPQKMIIHTSSNKSYYGFAQFMLPFQTAVSHMLPVLFSDAYHSAGADYPTSFYTDAYLKDIPGGLVTQGYHQDAEYGLGYYLDKIELAKTVEAENFPLQHVYSFFYDGEAHTIENRSDMLRQELSDLLESRKVFENWRPVNQEENRIKFLIDPEWSVQNQEDQLSIYDQNNAEVVSIEFFENIKLEQFSNFVLSELPQQSETEPSYLTDYMTPDFDHKHLMYISIDNPRVFYAVAGNNLLFYKFTVSQPQKAELFFRTIEIDDELRAE